MSAPLPPRPLPTTRQQVIDEMREAGRNTPRSPCVDQTREEIEAYYRKAQVGDRAAVRQTQARLLRYDIVDIERIDPKTGRVHISVYGAFYMKHGKNCWEPKGQTTLVVPTDAVVSWAFENPQGAFGFLTFKESDYPFP